MRNTAKSSFNGGRKMNITVINTEKEYLAACAKLDAFLASHADELDHLSTEADKEFRLLSRSVPKSIAAALGRTSVSGFCTKKTECHI